MSRPLHVAHFAEALGGGLLEMLRLVCAGHVEHGMRVSMVYGQRPETPDQEDELISGSEVSAERLPAWGERKLVGEAVAALRIQRWLRRERPDVAVFHSSFAGVAGSWGRGVPPTIFTPHAFASRVAGRRTVRVGLEAAERWACRRHDAVACVSRSEEHVARELGARQVTTISNGISALDDPMWSSQPRLPARPKVVGVGRLVPQRRPIEVARILEAVADVADVAWVGGGGSGRYAAQAATVLRDRSIPLTGWLSASDVDRRLKAASIYVHWTSWDGMPMSVLEALATDTVVVAANTPPNREVVGTAMTFDREADAVAEIRALALSPDRWRAALHAQRERARSYGARRMQQEWNDLVLQMADHAPRM